MRRRYERPRSSWGGLALVILLVVAAAVVGFVLWGNGKVTDSKLRTLEVQIGSLRNRLRNFLDLKGTLPATLNELDQYERLQGNWRDDMLTDPWGHPFEYVIVTSHDKKTGGWIFGLVSGGPDGDADSDNDLYYRSDDDKILTRRERDGALIGR